MVWDLMGGGDDIVGRMGEGNAIVWGVVVRDRRGQRGCNSRPNG